MTKDYITQKVVSLLPIDSEMYTEQLDVLVGGAMNKLNNEGVPNLFSETDDGAMDYIICVAYQVAMDLDLDLDLARMSTQYTTRVNTLRMSLNV